jgi:hypothetical protein
MIETTKLMMSMLLRSVCCTLQYHCHHHPHTLGFDFNIADLATISNMLQG